MPFLGIQPACSQNPAHTFTLGDSVFLLDGKPLQMISGEMHYTRIPREYWRDRIRKAKAMGLNTIGMYIFWNVHEPEPGQFDFDGNNDVAAFVRTAQEEGMWVVMRPSPYVCAEWEFGGYPWWLLKDPAIKVRSKDPAFLTAYRSYIMRLAKELVPLQVTHGGNILMIQIENEYGSYSNDQSYLDLNRQLFREAGLDVPLFTCDPAWAVPNGVLPGTLPAVNGSADPKEIKTLVNKYHGGKGPYYAAEFYPGWFDEWGKPHARGDAGADAKRLDGLLAAGISVNMYMFHGGTTRGFMNGANMNDRSPYAPQVSSYDYDAPLDEAGNPTAKYNLFRDVIRKYLPAGTTLPPIPEKQPAIVLPVIRLTKQVSLFDLALKPVVSADPLCFEDLDQAYGFVLYRTALPAEGAGVAAGPRVLRLHGMRDFATVYLDGKRIGVLDRRLKQDSLTLTPVAGATLDILVENNGRINFGKYLTDNRQGLTGAVTLSGKPLHDWKMYRFPFSTVGDIPYVHKAFSRQPGLYAGTFTLDKTGDTYLDMRGFGKGFVFLNGHNLGKYWQIGPQQTIYVPAVWLKKGLNEITVFDQLGSGHTSISTLSHAILDEQ